MALNVPANYGLNTLLQKFVNVRIRNQSQTRALSLPLTTFKPVSFLSESTKKL